jgi:two-component system, OmpR family, sensor kinase
MKRYGLALLPLLLACILAAVGQGGLLANPILYVRADLGSAMLALGVMLSLVWLLCAALRDRLARHCAEEMARHRQLQADAHLRFVRRLDHEMKNPLTALRAGLANLGEQDGDQTLDRVRTQVDRLARLSTDLRKLADLETQPLEKEPVHLDQLLSDLCEDAQQHPGAITRQLRLTLPTAPWPLPPVSGDADLLYLALHNLLDNAIKFSRPGDTVEMRASEDGSSVAVEVADTGPGIPEDETPHIGEELYRGDAARSVEGSGLGFALARAIVARHGGTLAIRSRAGQGTVVTLRLPTVR